MYKFVFVDANALGYAGNHEAMMCGDMHTSSINHVLGEVMELYRKHPKANVIFLWDKPAQWRYDIYPEYKGKRTDTEEKRIAKERYKSQVPMIKKMLYTLGVTQVSCENCEADDLAAYFASRVPKQHKALLVTGDKDWLQLVSPNVHWFEHRTKLTVNLGCFEAVTGCKNTTKFVYEKILQGDTSDNITGVGGIGPKASRELLNVYGSIGNVITVMAKEGLFTKDTIPEPLRRWRSAINALSDPHGESRQRLHRNNDLMNLRKGVVHVMKGELNVVAKRNLNLFRTLLEECAFHNILRNFDSYTETVRGNQSWEEISKLLQPA